MNSRAPELEESYVPIFLERYVLPVLATVTVGVVLLNPFHLVWQQQAGCAAAIITTAFAIGYMLHKRNKQRTSLPSVKQQSFGANSPNIIGSHNQVNERAEPKQNGKTP